MSNETNQGDEHNGQKIPLWEKLVTMILNAPWAAVLSIIVVLGAMAFVASVITGTDQRNDIRNTEYARGFITVLFRGNYWHCPPSYLERDLPDRCKRQGAI